MEDSKLKAISLLSAIVFALMQILPSGMVSADEDSINRALQRMEKEQFVLFQPSWRVKSDAITSNILASFIEYSTNDVEMKDLIDNGRYSISIEELEDKEPIGLKGPKIGRVDANIIVEELPWEIVTIDGELEKVPEEISDYINNRGMDIIDYQVKRTGDSYKAIWIGREKINDGEYVYYMNLQTFDREKKPLLVEPYTITEKMSSNEMDSIEYYTNVRSDGNIAILWIDKMPDAGQHENYIKMQVFDENGKALFKEDKVIMEGFIRNTRIVHLSNGNTAVFYDRPSDAVYNGVCLNIQIFDKNGDALFNDDINIGVAEWDIDLKKVVESPDGNLTIFWQQIEGYKIGDHLVNYSLKVQTLRSDGTLVYDENQTIIEKTFFAHAGYSIEHIEIYPEGKVAVFWREIEEISEGVFKHYIKVQFFNHGGGTFASSELSEAQVIAEIEPHSEFYKVFKLSDGTLFVFYRNRHSGIKRVQVIDRDGRPKLPLGSIGENALGLWKKDSSIINVIEIGEGKVAILWKEPAWRDGEYWLKARIFDRSTNQFDNYDKDSPTGGEPYISPSRIEGLNKIKKATLLSNGYMNITFIGKDGNPTIGIRQKFYTPDTLKPMAIDTTRSDKPQLGNDLTTNLLPNSRYRNRERSEFSNHMLQKRQEQLNNSVETKDSNPPSYFFDPVIPKDSKALQDELREDLLSYISLDMLEGAILEKKPTLEDAIKDLRNKEDKTDVEKAILEAAENVLGNIDYMDAETIKEFEEAIQLVKIAESMKGLVEGVNFDIITESLNELIKGQRELYDRYLKVTKKVYKEIEDTLAISTKDAILPDKFLLLSNISIDAKRKIAIDSILKKLFLKDETELTKKEKKALEIYDKTLKPKQDRYRKVFKTIIGKFTFDIKKAFMDAKPASTTKNKDLFKALFVLDERTL